MLVLRPFFFYFAMMSAMACASVDAATSHIVVEAAPKAPRTTCVDTYFGTPVPDPFRSLEHVDAPDVASWAKAQTARADASLKAAPHAAAMAQGLRRLSDHPRLGLPQVVGGVTYFRYNTGAQQHDILYTGEPQHLAQAQVRIDPLAVDATGKTALTGVSPGPKGGHMAYGLSVAGSDWQVWRIRRLKDNTDLPDTLTDIKFTDIAWTRDETAFYYARMVQAGQKARSVRADGQLQIYKHVLGTTQTEDALVFAHPDPAFDASMALSHDGAVLAVMTARGSERRQGLYICRLNDPTQTFVKLLGEGQASVTFVGADAARLVLMTTQDAPRGRVVQIDLTAPELAAHVNWTTLIPEHADTLFDVRWIGEDLWTTRIHHMASRLTRYSLDGASHKAPAPWPDLAWVTGPRADHDVDAFYVAATSNTLAPTTYRFTHDAAGWHANTIFAEAPGLDLKDFVTKRAFATSADGTEVPLIISHHKALKQDGHAPVRMYGYGGFTLPVYPAFHESNLLWMALGGVTVRTAARGGGEYGAGWHDDGRGHSKQHTFDDFAAAARYLIAEGYTTPQRLGIEGHSNGGLLVAASEVQHPELFGAVYCDVGVLDMLRFAQFTAGVGWRAEYGDVRVQADFRVLYGYSPVHNTKPGTHYPATLIVTGDHDDRVVPGHSYKFAAALQDAQGGKAPIFLQVGKDLGHGGAAAWAQGFAKEMDRLNFFASALKLEVPRRPVQEALPTG